ncbi:phosphotransferase [Adlercreutzia faecimuris]|uniref:Phosphotransferase n=1 Tax=Adlercreutzia faecimuris TaxID=2897341 RepID=A0ABS9WJ11_9ACTN|nr:phosphotransferase [Adlercreutzia sp. JBNU-10]MCI2242447.1 phosphotransferase [Adlercreutzia sp. JBNU-10]
MDSMERGLAEARAYLAGNAALRQAVGAAPGAVLEPRPLGMGEHNLNYAFADPADGRRFVLRVNVTRQPFHDNQVRYEFDALTALAPSGRVPAPLYLDDGPDAPGHGALVIGFCEGDELDFDRLRPGDLRCAAQLMADVHAVPVGPNCPLHRPTDPLRELFGECLARFDLYRASPAEDPRITRWVNALTAAAAAVADTPAAPGDCAHIVNTEPLPSHFLIPAAAAAEAARAGADDEGVGRGADVPTASAAAAPATRGGGGVSLAVGVAHPAGGAGARGRLCAAPGSFVDWERPVIGDVAQDVAFFTAPTTTFWDSDYLMGPDVAAAFVEDYWRAVDGRFSRGAFDARYRAFRMMAALRAVAWCCRALAQFGADPRLHRTDRAVAKVPAYLSDEFLEMLARDCFGL